MTARRLMAVLAHPDDESMGMGSTLAKYASEGVAVSLVVATRGDAGRYRGHAPGTPEHPGAAALATLREGELHAACDVLGIRERVLLDYHDQQLDRAHPPKVIGEIAREIRRLRPHIVLTFGPEGGYGHPDHIAISQLTAAAIVAAATAGDAGADGGVDAGGPAHVVSKFYYLAWPTSVLRAFEAAFRRLASTVDGFERPAVPWPDWMITTEIDTGTHWQAAWRAVACHDSQVAAYERLRGLAPEQHEAIWRWQHFYRVFSRVNGGRTRETDLFEGIAR